MSKDIYEENKRLKRDLESARNRNYELNQQLSERNTSLEASLTTFFAALVDGRLLLEQFNGNIPGWRVAIIPPPPAAPADTDKE